MRFRLHLPAIILILLLAISQLDARALRVEIASRADVLNGKQFGDAEATKGN
jgi:hypothetical protein